MKTLSQLVATGVRRSDLKIRDAHHPRDHTRIGHQKKRAAEKLRLNVSARALPGGAIGQRFGDKEDGTRRPAVDVDRRPCDGIVQFLDHADCSTAAGGSDRLARPRQLMAVRAAMMAAPFGEPRPVQAFQPGSGPAL